MTELSAPEVVKQVAQEIRRVAAEHPEVEFLQGEFINYPGENRVQMCSTELLERWGFPEIKDQRRSIYRLLHKLSGQLFEREIFLLSSLTNQPIPITGAIIIANDTLPQNKASFNAVADTLERIAPTAWYLGQPHDENT